MKKNIIILSSFSIGALIAFFFLTTNSNSENQQDLASTDNILSLQADYVDFENLNELEKDADLIVIGKPIHEFSDRNHFNIYGEENDLEDFYTETEVNIIQIIKGNEKIDLEETLKVIEPITYVSEDKLTITTEGYTALEKNLDYIIFLKENDFGDYGVIFNNAGKYDINSLSEKSPQVNNKITNTDQTSDEDLVKLKIWNEIQLKYQEHLN